MFSFDFVCLFFSFFFNILQWLKCHRKWMLCFWTLRGNQNTYREPKQTEENIWGPHRKDPHTRAMTFSDTERNISKTINIAALKSLTYKNKYRSFILPRWIFLDTTCTCLHPVTLLVFICTPVYPNLPKALNQPNRARGDEKDKSASSKDLASIRSPHRKLMAVHTNEATAEPSTGTIQSSSIKITLCVLPNSSLNSPYRNWDDGLFKYYMTKKKQKKQKTICT